jgi:hypothetical protein
MDGVASRVKEAPDMTLLGLIGEFDLPISQAALSKRLVGLGMTRLYGRAVGGGRVHEYVPDVRFERTSLMGALGLGGRPAGIQGSASRPQ